MKACSTGVLAIPSKSRQEEPGCYRTWKLPPTRIDASLEPRIAGAQIGGSDNFAACRLAGLDGCLDLGRVTFVAQASSFM
ncbi:hypothetical protein Pla22_15850 [Rubripirellula amarantea]|uniref:Uncharacterized protein n=1 Tax=Rubripirellula amarantea TaxID=2527999 RepID=A0A5C5WV21_9BACT|nr:hypothetical protein Pla22_15850 [Rubripirellula amarantea]